PSISSSRTSRRSRTCSSCFRPCIGRGSSSCKSSCNESQPGAVALRVDKPSLGKRATMVIDSGCGYEAKYVPALPASRSCRERDLDPADNRGGLHETTSLHRVGRRPGGNRRQCVGGRHRLVER